MKKMDLTCENCPYHYKGEDDDFPCCHWNEDAYDPYDKAPCEYEDDEEEGWE